MSPNSLRIPIIFLSLAAINRPLFSQQSVANKSLARGCQFLLEKQNEDGSWKSEYYGNLKQGAATTSLVLFALSNARDPRIKTQKKVVEKAFGFLRQGIQKHGYVCNVTGPDYANYATALTLLAARNFESRFHWQMLSDEERKKLVAFLVNSQLDETHGLDSKADDYGGWDLSGWMQSPRFSPGSNISVTSFVLSALAPEKGKSVAACRDKARLWIKRIRNTDGGFHFHPKKDHAGNKAEWVDDKSLMPQSYGTPTVDGMRALRSLELPETEVQKCVGWLEKNGLAHNNFVPGFSDQQNGDASWGQGLLYYYFMSLSLERQYLSAKLAKHYKKSTIDLLVTRQKKDGRWENSSARMREDDPLIATSFAVIALSQWKDAAANSNIRGAK